MEVNYKMVRKRRSKIPKGRITFKKVKGGFLINIKGKLFDEVTDKGAAKAGVKRIQSLRREDRKKRRPTTRRRIRR